jgi:hypothetical protein
MAVVSFRWERSSDRSRCDKYVGMDGNPFKNSKRTITKLMVVGYFEYSKKRNCHVPLRGTSRPN